MLTYIFKYVQTLKYLELEAAVEAECMYAHIIVYGLLQKVFTNLMYIQVKHNTYFDIHM